MTASVHSPAPGFDAVDQTGARHQLLDYRGAWLLLYFYPKDDTDGCTKEACGFRDLHPQFQPKVHIVGVSADSQESHRMFAEKYQLPFPLLVDTDRTIITAYGVGTLFPKRTSFLIDPNGVIQTIYEKIDCIAHAQQILDDIQALKTSA